MPAGMLDSDEFETRAVEMFEALYGDLPDDGTTTEFTPGE